MQRNGRTCSLCMTNYVMPRLFDFETIPLTNTVFLYFLNYPGLVLAAYHYVFVILISSNKSQRTFLELEFLYIVTQYFFHFLYILIASQEWRVQNRALYWAQMKTVWTPVIVGVHLYLFSQLQQSPSFVGPVLSFYMGLYWRAHVRMLENTNDHLLDLEI
jgi:hypothetical protein